MGLKYPCLNHIEYWQVRPFILTLADCWQMHEDRAHSASFAWSFMLSKALRSCGGTDMIGPRKSRQEKSKPWTNNWRNCIDRRLQRFCIALHCIATTASVSLTCHIERLLFIPDVNLSRQHPTKCPTCWKPCCIWCILTMRQHKYWVDVYTYPDNYRETTSKSFKGESSLSSCS